MKRLFVFLVAASCLIACNMAPKAHRMVIIGLDGLGSEYMDSLEIPVMRTLMAEGSYCLHKRSVLPSASAINWASIFNGLPTEIHGYTRWNSTRPDIPCVYETERGLPPTLFTICREQRPDEKIIALYEWDGVKFCLDTLALSEHRCLGEDPIDNVRSTDAVIECLTRERPDLFYVHYDSPDHEGHSFGFGGNEYKAKVELLDSCLGRIIDALKEAGMYDETVFVVISDHGGKNRSHGKASVEELEAPIIISGPGIPKGHEIPAPMLQYDVTPTLAGILGLKVPDFWRGRNQL
ncbi:MAG: alkaline phosphatase [Bacteroidales bacterium]|nr:alkaline phosphatase [Bacteroidales bacterium]